MSIKQLILSLAVLGASLAPALAEPQRWVIGGTTTPDGARPAVVQVLSSPSCSGVLVAPQVVLTAGHCLLGDPPAEVIIGSNEMLELDDAGSERIPVARSVAHPTADLAVLVLERASTITPAEIVRGCALDQMVNGANVSTVGFGATNVCGRPGNTELREARLSIDDVSCEGCAELFGPVFPAGQYMLASSPVSSGCLGDSGGPLFLHGDGEDLVAGIVQGGPGANGVPCALGAPNVFVRPDAFIPWIEEQAGITFDALSCGGGQARSRVGAAPVVGGVDVEENEFAPVALVSMVEGYCTGVLVAPDVVLTAEHCITDELPEVTIGAIELTGATGETIPVKSTITHPTLDMAIILLERSSATKPAVIAPTCDGESGLVAGAEAMMVGFGLSTRCGDPSIEPEVLRKGALTIVDPECRQEGLECEFPGAEILASAEDVNGCFGDSGGPLYLTTPDGPQLVGITSRGAVESDELAPCEGGGIYPRVDAIATWIEEQSGRKLTYAPCGGADSGGCTTAPGNGAGGLVLVGLGLVASRLRRRRADLR